MSETKICSRYRQEKDLAAFYVNPRYAGGYTARCRDCIKQAAKEWASENPERRRDVRLEWNARNRAQKCASSAALRQRKLSEPSSTLRRNDRERVKRWRAANPEKAAATEARAYRKRCIERPEVEKARRALNRDRMLAHPVRSIAYRVSGSVRSAIKRQSTKSTRTVELIGCSIPQFIAHIERQWLRGMSWENWGQGEGCWHLDHRNPVSSFDLTDAAQLVACFHYTNHQPLWAIDNLRKGARDPIEFARANGLLL